MSDTRQQTTQSSSYESMCTGTMRFLPSGPRVTFCSLETSTVYAVCVERVRSADHGQINASRAEPVRRSQDSQ